ncbi:unnamed protein product, partial [Macrosiphum euphorbiae]
PLQHNTMEALPASSHSSTPTSLKLSTLSTVKLHPPTTEEAPPTS